MITPSKTIPFKDSIVFKMTYILDEDFDDILLTKLYGITKKKFSGIDEFMYAIDVLYVLGKVEIDIDTGKVSKC